MNDYENKTAYVTKWGLSKGIYKVNGRYYPESNFFRVEARAMFLTVCKDCFFTLEEAQTKVIEMAKIKKNSLNKKIAKLDAIIEGNPVKIRELD